jgi:hypothetical protein
MHYLTVEDIYLNFFDFEQIKYKSANDALNAVKTIYNRGILSMAIKMNRGRECFTTVDKYMYDNNILHL